MQISSGSLAAAATANPLNSAADSLVQQANQLATGSGSGDKAKIHKAGQDFESLLLSQWLQQAEEGFAKVPGTDEEEDDGDPGAASLQGIGVQSLGQAMAASGGIGIAKMITSSLEKKATNATEVSQNAT